MCDVRKLLVGSNPHFIAKLLGRFHFDERPTHATVDVSRRICHQPRVRDIDRRGRSYISLLDIVVTIRVMVDESSKRATPSWSSEADSPGQHC